MDSVAAFMMGPGTCLGCLRTGALTPPLPTDVSVLAPPRQRRGIYTTRLIPVLATAFAPPAELYQWDVHGRSLTHTHGLPSL